MIRSESGSNWSVTPACSSSSGKSTTTSAGRGAASRHGVVRVTVVRKRRFGQLQFSSSAVDAGKQVLDTPKSTHSVTTMWLRIRSPRKGSAVQTSLSHTEPCLRLRSFVQIAGRSVPEILSSGM